jgi:hypothetical protein
MKYLNLPSPVKNSNQRLTLTPPPPCNFKPAAPGCIVLIGVGARRCGLILVRHASQKRDSQELYDEAQESRYRVE